MDRPVVSHGGVAARGVENSEPFLLGQLSISVLVRFVKHLSNLEISQSYKIIFLCVSGLEGKSFASLY